MNPVTSSYENERESFCLFINDLILREVSLFFPLKRECPLDDEFTRAASMYAFLFFDAYYKVEPTLEEIGLFLGRGKDVGELYQDSIYWYKRWKDDDLSSSSLSFCELINKLVLMKAQSAKKASWLLLPDFRSLRRAVERKLSGEANKEAALWTGLAPIF